MEENYFATSRNGHELKDMNDPVTNTLDIPSNGLYPSKLKHISEVMRRNMQALRMLQK